MFDEDNRKEIPKMVKEVQFIDQFIKISKDREKLKKLLRKTNNEVICETIVDNASDELGLKMWTLVLILLDDEKELLKILEGVSETC